MKQVVSASVMRESDRRTIETGISGRELMRRAGEAVYTSHPWRGPVAIVCGGGNNAGDGYVLATLLQKNHIRCTVLLLYDRFSEDGAYFFEACRASGVEICPYTQDFDFSPYTEIVDCMFGTGFSGELCENAAHAADAINQSGKYVIAVDINSGLCADSGRTKKCVIADLTVSIGYYKNGHFLGNAKDVIKQAVNANIGIDLYGECGYLLEKEDLQGRFPPRPQNSHKGAYGYVSLLGGCSAYSGAVKLANMSCAALRMGCGVAQLIVPASLEASVSPYLLESTLALMPQKDGAMLYDPTALDKALSRQSALAIGMGWGRAPQYARILEHILRQYQIPVIIDADGLNTLAEMDLAILKESACRIILTPHAKEMERLCRRSVDEILSNPIGVCRQFAAEHDVCLLLKGPCTIITDGHVTYLVDRGCAGMATAGSGDVLSGVLAGLLGWAEPTPLTVAMGAYVAGRAGELAEQRLNPISMLASDTVSMLPRAISELL